MTREPHAINGTTDRAPAAVAPGGVRGKPSPSGRVGAGRRRCGRCRIRRRADTGAGARPVSRHHGHGVRQLSHAQGCRRPAGARQGAVRWRRRLRHPALRRHRAQHHARPGNRDRPVDRRRDQAGDHAGRSSESRPARGQAPRRPDGSRTSSRRCSRPISTRSSPTCARFRPCATPRRRRPIGCRSGARPLPRRTAASPSAT